MTARRVAVLLAQIGQHDRKYALVERRGRVVVEVDVHAALQLQAATVSGLRATVRMSCTGAIPASLARWFSTNCFSVTDPR